MEIPEFFKNLIRRLDRVFGGKLIGLGRELIYNFRKEKKKEELLEVDGMKIYLDTSEDHQRKLADGGHELEQKKLFKKYVKNSEVVYDVGANIGIYSLIALNSSENVKVFAFEPEPESYNHLKRNVRVNGWNDRFKAINAGVSDSKGKMSLHVSRTTNKATHSLARNEHHGLKTIEVDVLSLDQFSKDNPAPDIIKIDVEGAEELVLEGMQEILQKHEPTIFLDVHGVELERMGGSAKKIYREMVGSGYNVYDIKQKKQVKTEKSIKLPGRWLLSKEPTKKN